MKALLFSHPGLECTQCIKVYKEANQTPLCFSPEGCEIEDLATDEELTEKIDKFMTAKALYNQTGDSRTQERTFTELGLYDDPGNHLKIERIYAKWLSKIQMQALQKKSRT